jgi:hypothetical protein
MSAEQRQVIESLLGRRVRDEEWVTIRSTVIKKDAPVGEERLSAARQYQHHLDELAQRVKDVPEEELNAAIEEAVEYARHRAG